MTPCEFSNFMSISNEEVDALFPELENEIFMPFWHYAIDQDGDLWKYTNFLHQPIHLFRYLGNKKGWGDEEHIFSDDPNICVVCIIP